MKHKVLCVYNKFFFEKLYKFMLQQQFDTARDASDTIWHIQDVEDILISEYGYKRSSTGSIF